MKLSKTGGRTDAEKAETGLVELFRALESPLLGFAYQMVKDEQLAQDIVQEAFIRLQTHFHEVEHAKAWLYTTVRRMAIDQIRRNRKVVPFSSGDPDEDRPELDPADAAPTPDEAADLHERTGLLRVCLERLASRERKLVQLKFVEELSYKEIAAKMGMTVGHVGYQLHHALKSLELELREEGVAK
ncbi:MAG TPA: sigma-70 family RNA polymerase sigma factor [Opitutales bacterium]|nr:sigma-70 family RNA polymerase sigma factor [Opitutales bacterium]